MLKQCPACKANIYVSGRGTFAAHARHNGRKFVECKMSHRLVKAESESREPVKGNESAGS